MQLRQIPGNADMGEGSKIPGRSGAVENGGEVGARPLGGLRINDGVSAVKRIFGGYLR